LFRKYEHFIVAAVDLQWATGTLWRFQGLLGEIVEVEIMSSVLRVGLVAVAALCAR